MVTLGGGEIRFLVNTHLHWDHIWGNAFHGDEGAVVIAHPGVRQYMLDEALPESDEKIARAALPVITTDSSLTLHFNGEDVKDSITYIKARKLAGDSVEQIVEAGLPDRFGSYSVRPRFVSEERWIQAVY